MTQSQIVKVAAVQLQPVLDSADGTVERVLDEIAAAAADGAQLVVFPETAVPYYPYWSFVMAPMAMGARHRTLYDHSPTVPGPVTDAVAAAAATKAPPPRRPPARRAMSGWGTARRW